MKIDQETKAEVEHLRRDPSLRSAATLVEILADLDHEGDPDPDLWDLLTVARHRVRSEPATTPAEMRAKISAWRAELDAAVERPARETKAGLETRLDAAFHKGLDGLMVLDAVLKDVEAGRPIGLTVPRRCEI